MLDKSAESISAAYVKDVFSRFGGSRIILSDNCGAFKNALF
jgi:hypothetical protein